ncbi:MAG TPA: 23S rRNA (adenine(2030)-N(6))-methyltransferase RlmJ [Gammaproteobacteria bacterium]|nr:23S rRNA (adenine(2030)-N(6))-methyltransferase RlmJ [Gammaproteobacteria bacterium]
MNYRHRYHAGNFADLMKHALLVCLLEALSRKAAPWCYFDSHAGAGLYDIAAGAAQRTGEAAAGIGRLWPLRATAPGAVLTLCRIVADCNPDSAVPRYYPGSPRIAAALTRGQDRLILAERHPEEAACLKQQCRTTPQAAVHLRDGYEMVPALVPPAERRGLVLMDPPFERADEFEALAGACLAAHTRWPGGVYALWYPLKEAAPVARFERTLRRSGMRRILLAELRLGPGQGPMLAGSGLAIVNPPWQCELGMAEALSFLAHALAPGQSSHALRWLVGE